ncbi:hypothetical protein [Roseovarius sp. EL26]|uniref:hypothetical protein n=1 Tax=Roseovarius sp. EL26 TaxID=2126672 RepID=UPI000EA11D98|nr:hypothetical protein [Roseovarius sp. EL26]
MGEILNNAIAEQRPIFVARESFVGELKALTKQHPNVGFGVSLQTHAGEHYLLANVNMPLPDTKDKGFPTGRTIACLENGARFKAVEVLADIEAAEARDPRAEAALLGDVMKLIAQIEAPTSLPVGRFVSQVENVCAANGTGG